MDLRSRNNVKVAGQGTATLVFSHGFGCDQSMWRLLAPHFAGRFKLITYDLVGAGQATLAGYDRHKYSSLQGYASDLAELIAEYGEGPVVVIGHSVSAMIAVLADLAVPGSIAGHVMVGPSPCYINHPGYTGGFERGDIDSLLATLESNYLGWASNMAPAIMGAPGQPALGDELTNSFCRTDPEIAKQFARLTFFSDNRQDVRGLATPALILQSLEDIIAPPEVGEYLHAAMPNSSLCVIDNIGHCPHLSAPSQCAAAIDGFLARLGLA